jgi:arylsulfatase A-like enzyme
VRLGLLRGPIVIGTLAAVAALSTAALHRSEAFSLTAQSIQAPADDGPNVLIIITDDHRARGTMSVMPETRKWFGKQGTRFDNGFVTTPTCCPSRASIFTGMYAHNHGVHTNAPGEAQFLDPSRTVQHQLNESGYSTALFGKYLNEWDVEEPPPSFDRWGMFGDRFRVAYRNGLWNIDGSVRRVKTYSTLFIQRLAQRFIRETENDDAEPWMMVLTPVAPHAPSIPLDRDRTADVPRFRITPDIREEDRSDKPSFTHGPGPSLASVRKDRTRQLRTLMSVDRMVARVRDTLAKSGELADTLAFYTSDNGLTWGAHGLSGKGVAYEPSVRVPLFATWPNMFTAGNRDQRLVANIDIAPTIYEATGVTPSFDVDGRSLLGSFQRDRLLLEHYKRVDRETPSWAAHRTLDYKYIEAYVAGHVVMDSREFYDLTKDPWELENLFSSNSAHTGADPIQLHADLSCSGTEGATACP